MQFCAKREKRQCHGVYFILLLRVRLCGIYEVVMRMLVLVLVEVVMVRGVSEDVVNFGGVEAVQQI